MPISERWRKMMWTQLATAWPSAIPPEKPAKTPDEVSQLIQTIEQETQSVVK